MILAPFGLAGTLTGQIYKSTDISARLLDEWSHFYPLDRSNSLLDSNMIEVIVGGVKMRYPSCYVFVTDMDDQINLQILNQQQQQGGQNQTQTNTPTIETQTQTTNKINNNNSNSNNINNSSNIQISIQTPPPSPIQINSRVPQPGPYSVSVEHLNSMSREPTAAQILPERVWQECLLNGPQQQQQEFTGNWDFVQPTRKISCACSK